MYIFPTTLSNSGESLVILYNPYLMSIQGLGGLQGSMQGQLFVKHNLRLHNLAGLEAVKAWLGGIDIRGSGTSTGAACRNWETETWETWLNIRDSNQPRPATRVGCQVGDLFQTGLMPPLTEAASS